MPMTIQTKQLLNVMICFSFSYFRIIFVLKMKTKQNMFEANENRSKIENHVNANTNSMFAHTKSIILYLYS